jgi:2,4-dienoyl-CoA reductase-like NADH-dependent reductase (Old Yellow Enzyme family)
MRAAVAPDFPITVKLGIRDFVPDGLDIEEGIATAVALDQAGVDAIEISAGLATTRMESTIKYAGLSRKRAIRDKLIHRAFAEEVPGNYFVDDARRVRAAVSCPVIVVGGLRRIETMESIIREGIAEFVSLGRPLIREPDLVRKIENGKRGEVDCVSCNICAVHVGVNPLKCWR